MPEHLDALLKQASVVPAVNQVEVHPYFTQPAVQAADAAHGVLTQAWTHSTPAYAAALSRTTSRSPAYGQAIPEAWHHRAAPGIAPVQASGPSRDSKRHDGFLVIGQARERSRPVR